jgi:hypothetical protein
VPTDSDPDHPVDGLPTPDPALGPGEAVAVQLDALRTNDDPHPDAGCETAYNFASPANRRATGPRDRFVRMVTGRTYAPLVDHREAVAGPVERTGNVAEQRVTVTGGDGRTVTYTFGLSLLATGPFRNCWATDRVVPDRPARDTDS